MLGGSFTLTETDIEKCNKKITTNVKYSFSLGKIWVGNPLLKHIVHVLVSVLISVIAPLTQIMTESWTRFSVQWKLSYGDILLYTADTNKERLIKLMYERILPME